MTNAAFEGMLAALEKQEWSFKYNEMDNYIDLYDVKVYPYMDHLLLSYTVSRSEDDFEIYEREVDDVEHAFLEIEKIQRDELV
jgi:hypothetical protein